MKPAPVLLPLKAIDTIEGDRVVEVTYGAPSNRWGVITEVKVCAKLGDPVPQRVRVRVEEV